MPRIVVTSDLHYGITPERTLRSLAEDIAARQPDLTVLAGDLGEPAERFAACLDCFRELPGQVAVLAGNHDVWHRKGTHSSEHLWTHVLPELTATMGMIWLETEIWRRESIGLAGSMAWYDYSAVDPSLPPYPVDYFVTLKRGFHPDARYIDWPWADVELANRLGDAMLGRVMALEADPTISAIMVVTHVPLFDAQMCRKPQDEVWGLTNAYFGNLTLGKRLLTAKKLRWVISGHTHVGRRAEIPPDDQLTGAPMLVEVIDSDYGRPVFLVYDL